MCLRNDISRANGPTFPQELEAILWASLSHKWACPCETLSGGRHCLRRSFLLFSIGRPVQQVRQGRSGLLRGRSPASCRIGDKPPDCPGAPGQRGSPAGRPPALPGLTTPGRGSSSVSVVPSSSISTTRSVSSRRACGSTLWSGLRCLPPRPNTERMCCSRGL